MSAPPSTSVPSGVPRISGPPGPRAHDRRLEAAAAQVVDRDDPAVAQPARRGVLHGGLGVGDQQWRLEPGRPRDLLEPPAARGRPGRGVGEHDPLRRPALPVGHPRHDVAQLGAQQGGHGVRHVAQPDRLGVAQPPLEPAGPPAPAG